MSLLTANWVEKLNKNYRFNKLMTAVVRYTSDWGLQSII